jgi:hypothetical protein
MDQWLRPLRQLSFPLLAFLFGSRDFLLQRRYQVVLAIHLLAHEFSLPFQTLNLLGIGQRLCYRRAESQGTGADEGATHQALCGTHSHLHLSGENCCELEAIRALNNCQIAIVFRCKYRTSVAKLSPHPACHDESMVTSISKRSGPSGVPQRLHGAIVEVRPVRRLEGSKVILLFRNQVASERDGLPPSGLRLNDGLIPVSLKKGHAPIADYVRRLREVLPAAYPSDTFYFQAAEPA